MSHNQNNDLFNLKVSQNWFAGAEQIFVTVFLAFSPLLGTMLSQALTPALVSTPEDIPTMNWVWPIFSTITLIMFVFLVRTSLPPTPPSKSAEMVRFPGKRNYTQKHEKS